MENEKKKIFYRYFYYNKKYGFIIFIRGKRKPIKRKLFYVVNEYDEKNCKWGMACFPEIYWGTLAEEYIYLGKIKED